MAVERTVPERLKSRLLGQMAIAFKALSAQRVLGEREAAAHNFTEFDPAPNSDALHILVPRCEEATAREPAEIAQVISHHLREMKDIVSHLALHGEMAGEASGHLAAMSRCSCSSAQGMLRQPRDMASRAHALGEITGDAPGAPPDMRSESAFLSGAAHTLESSIDGASEAITDLAVAITIAAASAAAGSAADEQAERLAQHADSTIARLYDATRKIGEIVAYIHKVAVPTNQQVRADQRQQVPSEIHAIACAIIEGADEARQLIGDVSAVIARVHDAMLAIAVEASDLSDAANGSGPPTYQRDRVSISYRS